MPLSVILLLLVLLGGCVTVPGPVIDSFCAEYEPIMVSRLDVLTDETAHQIETQNWWWDQKCNDGRMMEAMRGDK